MLKLRQLTILVLLTAFFSGNLFADTLYLKNGKSVQGIITREENDDVEIDVGGGTVLFKATEIERVEMSGSKGLAEVKKHWETEKMRVERRKREERDERKKSAEKWDAMVTEETRRRAEKRDMEANSKAVPFANFGGHLLVRVVLNDNARAALVIDTGCPGLLLTADVGRKLGIDLKNAKNPYNVMVLNGKHRVTKVMLDSLKLGDIEEKNIEAEVMVDDDRQMQQGLKDGLLGMSFLNRFDMTVDQKKMKLILRPHKQNEVKA